MNTPSENNSADDVYNRIISGAEKYDPYEADLSWHHFHEDRKKLRKEWKEDIEKRRKDPNLLLKHYCYEIRNELDPCDQTFEDYIQTLQESWKAGHSPNEVLNNIDYSLLYTNKKPEGMSDKEFIKKRKELRKQRKQENKERKADQVLEQNTPFWILWNKIRIISCQCTAEGLRQGINCDTCKLFLRVDNYMMDLFKDVAEGRRTV